jgi:hypothetical protein
MSKRTTRHIDLNMNLANAKPNKGQKKIGVENMYKYLELQTCMLVLIVNIDKHWSIKTKEQHTFS